MMRHSHEATIAIAVSGGIDSLTAAYLLKESGAYVVGLHFITGFEPRPLDVTRIAAQINIPVHTLDLRRRFKADVVDYFCRTYRMGKTPNPCLICNPLIKFGVLFQRAVQLGSRQLATGHYARIHTDASGRAHLLRGVDRQKDQSYFLAFLSQQQLATACFPLGGLTKSKVKEMASACGLQPLSPSESQDVCFIRNDRYGDFLTQFGGLVPQPGDIVDTAGRTVGRHAGLHRFTVGQRRGINCPATEPYYVVELDTVHNRLIVGHQKDLHVSRCRVTRINWIQTHPDESIQVHARLRYRHRAAPATLKPWGPASADLVFQTPQAAVTPGQGAVFYDGDEVLGGGWIEEGQR